MRLASLLCGLLLSLPAIAWDNFGHRLVARTVYSGLQAEVREKVDELLGGGVRAFAEAGVWADRIKAQRPHTRPWHYVNIPLHEEGYDAERYCPRGNCIVVKLTEFIATLKSDTTTTDEKKEALRFIIHFVADIHQPLHCANDDDRGGNDLVLMWGNRKTNLHKIWDHYVLPDTLNQMPDLQPGGSVVDWCNESHGIAQTVAYEGLPDAGGTVSDDYMQKVRSTAVGQLAKAAARLAQVLNEALVGSP